MKKLSVFLMALSCCLVFLAASSEAFAQKDRLDNPIYKPAIDWLKDPTPCPDSTASKPEEMKAYTETIPGTEVQFKMLPIPGGKFLMGSPEDEEGRLEDEGPQHEVRIEPFWMEEHETTWKEFELYALKYLRDVHARKTGELTFREKLADAFAQPTPAYNISSISYSKNEKPGFPASGMTYYAAQSYCKWLTALTGRYYRLPTEAEWEYACRAGGTTPFSFGDDPEAADDYVVYYENIDEDDEGYAKVKSKKPNKWGLYDMHGNVSEWVVDQYQADAYAKRASGELKESFVQPKGDFGQIARGGNCDDDDLTNLRSARRLYSVEKWKAQDPQYPQSIWWVTDAAFVGFRIVRPLRTPTKEEAATYEPIPDVWKKYDEQSTKN